MIILMIIMNFSPCIQQLRRVQSSSIDTRCIESQHKDWKTPLAEGYRVNIKDHTHACHCKPWVFGQPPRQVESSIAPCCTLLCNTSGMWRSAWNIVTLRCVVSCQSIEIIPFEHKLIKTVPMQNMATIGNMQWFPTRVQKLISQSSIELRVKVIMKAHTSRHTVQLRSSAFSTHWK